ncbi:DUF45 domain-containing protein [Roseomonas gilardii]|uniref:DUF45 domain-containing protein n=1 Tax=Roseomonas gilardii TaxID=257708 RepID=UPI002114850A|nr:DUF45 domain-containing protein [Roseomonas gilardii]
MSPGPRPGILPAMEPSTTESVPLRAGPLTRPIPCPVRWQRSSRARRVSLRIDPCAAEVIVTLPPRASRQQGMALLTAHAAWVMERLSSLAPPQLFQDGAEIPLGGVPHPIRHEPQARGAPSSRTGASSFPARRNSSRAGSGTSCGPRRGDGSRRWWRIMPRRWRCARARSG